MLKPDRRGSLSIFQDLMDLRDPAAPHHPGPANHTDGDAPFQDGADSPHATATPIDASAVSMAEPAADQDSSVGEPSHQSAFALAAFDDDGAFDLTAATPVSSATDSDDGSAGGSWHGAPVGSGSAWNTAPAPFAPAAGDSVVVHESLQLSDSAFVWKQSIDTWSPDGHAAASDGAPRSRTGLNTRTQTVIRP